MKFLNLSTGYSFDGIWEESQQKGYIFWFPNEQSVGITYTMTICALTENNEPLNLSIEENEIFSFISHNNEIIVDGYKFNKPIYSNQITTTPESIGKYFAHIFNVSCYSKNAGEYICRINIENQGYIRVGADLYDEYEPVYINLSNMGVELPDNIQKAIYNSNVHEDVKDNILMNRKLKELLSNYWNIVANKGSQKSLKNSVDWFEWGDILDIREIQRNIVANKSFFSDKDIISSINDNCEESFSNFIKTSYISLYCSLQNELDTYDSELNPNLEEIVLKWSKEDVQLKMALLANFFGIYFMPIHISILHATVEDKVFTNTIKTITATNIKRNDSFGDFGYIECNVKDGSIFKMTNVKAQVTKDTVYGIKDESDEYFGVDVFPKSTNDTNSLIIFSKQYYSGPGVIIPFKMILSKQDRHDFVKETIVNYINGNGEPTMLNFYDIFVTNKNSININFNLLVKVPKDYTIIFTFILSSGKTITRRVEFSVELADNININVYKIKSKDDSNGFTTEDFKDSSMNRYFYSIQNNSTNTNNLYKRYLPYITPNNTLYSDYNGLKLNRTIAIRVNNDESIPEIRSIMSNDFLEFTKQIPDEDETIGVRTGLIFVSKRFFANMPSDLSFDSEDYTIIRNDLGFYPQFHHLEKIDGNTIEEYIVYQHEAICCAAEINDGKIAKEFKYGDILNETEWNFSNFNEIIEFPASSQQPFISHDTNKLLTPGFYSVSFKYSLSGIITETKLDSAFRIKALL